MVAMPGASSDQTGRTGQGAWSMTSRLAGPRLRGSQAGTVGVAGRDDQPAPSAAAIEIKEYLRGANGSARPPPWSRRPG
jgi:hypothetical protein